MKKHQYLYLIILLFLYSCTKKCLDPNSHTYNQRESCETCTDELKNGDEQDIDCGGALCENPCITFINWNTSNSSIPDNTINDLSFDNAGNIWLATGFGISKFDGTNFTSWNETNSNIQSNSVYAIENHNNNVYVGTINDGLSMFDGVNWTHFSSNSNVNYSINDIVEYNGKIYVATSFRGVSVFEDTTYIETFNTDNSDIPSNNIREIKFDAIGNMWLATSIGVTKFDFTTWTNFNTSNSDILDNYISDIQIDNDNLPWISNSNGIQSYNGNAWVTKNSEITNTFELGYFKNDNTIWVFNGLTYRHENNWFQYSEKDITGISSESQNSYLWVGALNEGLYRINYQ